MSGTGKDGEAVGEGALLCRLCNGPVTATREWYEVQERMHWICFHIVYEHCGDPDEPCGDPSCPWRHIEIFRRKLEQLGHDPDDVVFRANIGEDP